MRIINNSTVFRESFFEAIRGPAVEFEIQGVMALDQADGLRGQCVPAGTVKVDIDIVNRGIGPAKNAPEDGQGFGESLLETDDDEVVLDVRFGPVQ